MLPGELLAAIAAFAVAVGAVGYVRFAKDRAPLKSWEKLPERTKEEALAALQSVESARQQCALSDPAKSDTETVSSSSSLRASEIVDDNVEAKPTEKKPLLAAVGSMALQLTGLPLLLGDENEIERNVMEPAASQNQRETSNEPAEWSDADDYADDSFEEDDDDGATRQSAAEVDTDDEFVDNNKVLNVLDGLEFYAAVSQLATLTAKATIESGLVRAAAILHVERRKEGVGAIEARYNDAKVSQQHVTKKPLPDTINVNNNYDEDVQQQIKRALSPTSATATSTPTLKAA